MRVAKCHLKSASPLSFGKFIQTKKSRDVTHDEHEEATWRERMHYDDKGVVFIPPTAFKNALSEAAKYKPIQIPGKGKSTYTKHIEAGVMVVEPIMLGIYKDTVSGEWVHVPSDGRRGGTTRVMKCFPFIPKWEGVIEFQLLEDIIPEEIFATYLEDVGKFIGVGRFRPRNNGYYGRFEVVSIEWS